MASGNSRSSSTSSGDGEYGGWAFKEGKFRNIHWRMYQPDTPPGTPQQVSSMYAVQPKQNKKSGGDLLKSCLEH